MTEYTLYVPREGREGSIARGSAIVGEEAENGYVSTHYEGAVYGSMDFEEKVLHAAGRRAERYPTSALRAWPSSDLIAVGTVRKDRVLGWIVSDVSDPDALAAWAGEEVVPGGSRKLKEAAAGRAWSKLGTSAQAEVMVRQRTGADMVDEILARV